MFGRRIKLKTPEEIAGMKRAGKLSAQVLREIGARCVPGVTTAELDRFAEEFIRDNGGTPTFKGYDGFPGSICASVNNQIVHGIPSKTTVLNEGDIISIDVGATVDGWAGDNAWTFAVGEVAPSSARLLEATEKCMWAGIDAARAGNRVGDIGFAVESTAERLGFHVVPELTGHGIGHNMHERPDVPNYANAHHGPKLRPGMVLAIEPLVAAGSPRIHFEPDGWLIVTKDGSRAAHFEKTIAVTEGEPELISVEPNHRRPL